MNHFSFWLYCLSAVIGLNRTTAHSLRSAHFLYFVHPFPKLLFFFFFFTTLWWHFTFSKFFHDVNICIAKEYKETAFVWNAWHCQTLEWPLLNVVCTPFFFFNRSINCCTGSLNAYRVLYETVDSFCVPLLLYFSRLFSAVVAHCICMPLLKTYLPYISCVSTKWSGFAWKNRI